MKDFSEEYLRKWIEMAKFLFKTWKTMEDEDPLKQEIETRLETVLTELVWLTDLKEEEKEEYELRLKYYGIYTYKNGEQTTIVEEIINKSELSLSRMSFLRVRKELAIREMKKEALQ